MRWQNGTDNRRYVAREVKDLVKSNRASLCHDRTRKRLALPVALQKLQELVSAPGGSEAEVAAEAAEAKAQAAAQLGFDVKQQAKELAREEHMDSAWEVLKEELGMQQELKVQDLLEHREKEIDQLREQLRKYRGARRATKRRWR